MVDLTNDIYEFWNQYKSGSNSKLPRGWEEMKTKEGKVYYVDHINRRSSWTPPIVNNPSPSSTTTSTQKENEDMEKEKTNEVDVPKQEKKEENLQSKNIENNHDNSTETITSPKEATLHTVQEEENLQAEKEEKGKEKTLCVVKEENRPIIKKQDIAELSNEGELSSEILNWLNEEIEGLNIKEGEESTFVIE